MWSSILFATALLAVSGVLIVWRAGWRRADHGGLTDAFVLLPESFRRRIQASALVGSLVLALVDLWIADVTSRAVLWCVVLLLVLWTVVLAASDWLASRLHFDTLLSAHAVEHALLQREIKEFQREQGQASGDAKTGSPPDR
jgi:hypothetical protein